MKNTKITTDRLRVQPGTKCNRLTLLTPVGRDKNGAQTWECLCDCGERVIAVASRVLRGKTKSCGCYQTEILQKRKTTHGHSNNSGTYVSWQRMRSRCYNPNDIGYHKYGGRGIKVCDAWRDSFEMFLADMGERPEDHSIERQDNDGNYEPGNCIWASSGHQMRNTRRSKFVEIFGSRLNVKDAEKSLGVHRSSINQRCRQTGQSYQEAADHFARKLIVRNTSSVTKSTAMIHDLLTKIAA